MKLGFRTHKKGGETGKNIKEDNSCASHPPVNIAVQRLRVVSDSDTIKQLSWDSIEQNPSPPV